MRLGRKQLFLGEMVAGNYLSKEQSWVHSKGAGTWYILKQETQTGNRECGDQRKSQMKEIRGTKEGKSIQTEGVPVQRMKSSMSMVKKSL